jgi:Flp pilus assembly protein TadG
MRPTLIGEHPRRDRESGQATTEFALIFIPLMMVVAGIIYFGIGLNYWLDMNRVANQGARWAAVDNWPSVCPRSTASGYSCTSTYPTCSQTMAAGSQAKLQEVLRCSPRNNPSVTLCYPGKTAATAAIGDPVQVTLSAPYKFFFVNSVRINLVARATMRLEQKPTLQTGGLGPSCPT